MRFGRIHIVDEDAHVRARLSSMLCENGFYAEIWESGADLVNGANLRSACILLHISCADTGVGELLNHLKAKAVPTIATVARADIRAAVLAMKLGAVDVLEKPIDNIAVMAALGTAHSVAGMARPLSATEACALIDTLSPRETEVLRYLMAGLSSKAAADRLGLSTRTIEMHRANMAIKLDASSVAQKVMIGLLAGLEPQEV